MYSLFFFFFYGGEYAVACVCAVLAGKAFLLADWLNVTCPNNIFIFQLINR